MMKIWLASRLRQLLRRPEEQADFRLVSGHEIGEDISIDSLIYPLRYDIIVRAKFMSYYQQHRDFYAHDFEAFLAHPAARAYFFSWFSDARRSRPKLGLYPASAQKVFEGRVRRAVGLFESLESSGFDYSYPIELRAASLIRHEHDKHVRRRFYAGDGCHRLAFLASQGMTSLTPRHYCVRVFEEFRPRDNTYLLLGQLLRTEGEYCRIISKYYCSDTEYDRPQGILEHVERYSPHQRDEVASVMREDLRRISETTGRNEGNSLEGSGGGRVPQD